MSWTWEPSLCRVSTKTNSGCSIVRRVFPSISKSISDINFALIASWIAFRGTMDTWWGGIVTVVVVIKCVLYSISVCPFV